MSETTPRRNRPTIAQATALVFALIFVCSGIAAGGPLGALAGLGLVLLVVGLGALAVGHARWARIAGRRGAGMVVGIGVIALVIGGQGMPDRKPAADHVSAASPTSAADASLAAEESAIQQAEKSLAAAEDDSSSGTGNVAASSLLDDGAATQAVNSAAGTSPSTALAALSAIPVKGRAPMTGYTRSQFGAAWADVDHNGCDTRNDILARDLNGETFKPGTHNCVVLTGSLADPYSGRTIAFQRGVTTSSAVQIDHVVALGDAWQTGAQGWSVATRTAFANDPRNLLAVDGPLNEQKGDGDDATWLPPNKAFRCAYVARQVAVKATYGLWMTQAEKDASATILATCPTVTLPDGVAVTVAAPTTAAPTTAAPPVVTRAPAPVPTRAPAPRTTVAPAPAPAPAPGAPTARCNDGTLSYSQTHSGTCSHHGGVAAWLN